MTDVPMWFELVIQRWLPQVRREEGQTEIIIALAVLILILMLAGRRVVVQ